MGLGGGHAVGLVSAAKFCEILGLVVKDLFHLLARYHFLHIAVDGAQIFLLFNKVAAAAAAVVFHKYHHAAQEHKYDHGQPPVQDQEHGDGAGDIDEALNHHGKARV